MRLENVKAIFFDADDTIVDHRQCEKKALWIYVKFLDTFFENFFIYMRPLSFLYDILNLHWYKWYTSAPYVAIYTNINLEFVVFRKSILKL